MQHECEKPFSNGISLRGPFPWEAVLAVLLFLIGTLFSAGMGWGKDSSSLTNISLSLSHLEVELQALTEKYSVSDKATAQELQKIEDHLSYDDRRLDKLEAAKEKRP